MAKKLNVRASAAKLSWQIIDKGQSLDNSLSEFFEGAGLPPEDRGLVQEIVYGVCRWYGELDYYASLLLQKPIRNKDRTAHFLLLVGIYQLKHMNIPAHAAVSETVAACQQLQKIWAKNLLNSCLRRWQREQSELEVEPMQAQLLSHPHWLADELKTAWPEYWKLILEANNARPAMCLRVNQLQNSRDDYLQALVDAHIKATADPLTKNGIKLIKPKAVSSLPGFSTGAASVQDTAAQLAAEILAPEKGHSVLDACAAPGGKTAHLLEVGNNQIALDAVDISEHRTTQTKDTLDRLKLSANVYCADAAQAASWPTPDNGYDKILIDAPCSGTGVIRRHPDIRHHRQLTDIEQLEKTQYALLNNLWAYLKSGGHLLYMTCSVIPRENEQQIAKFLSLTESAEVLEFEHPSAIALNHGFQTLPGIHDMDGFYFCLLRKL